MPTNKTHVITGAGVGVVMAAALQMPIMPLIIGATIGAGIPDIDSEKSSISSKFLIFKSRAILQITYIAIGLAAILCGNLSLKLLGGFLILAAISGHRKFTHSLIGFLGFVAICGVSFETITSNPIIRYMVLGSIIGYAVHILADSFSNHGIELFWPFYSKNFGLRIISTGRISEYIFLSAAVIVMVLAYNYFAQYQKVWIWTVGNF